MKNLKVKMKKQAGFTLVEMLIVVAIIAILVAVSIPMVNSSLEKAKEATDDANLRAAKAVALMMFMNDQADGVAGKTGASLINGYYYDIDNSTFVETAPTAYGKLSSNNYIKVTVTDADTAPTVAWE